MYGNLIVVFNVFASYGACMNVINADETSGEQALSRLEMLQCQSGAAVLRNGQICRMKTPIRRRVLGGSDENFCYHVMTRTCGAERMLEAEDLEGLRIIIRKMALFSGVKVMTYCLLANHWHLLVKVPSKEKFLRQFDDRNGEPFGSGEARLMGHLATLYSKAYIEQLKLELADMRERGLEDAAREVIEKYKRRFCDLSLYVKEVKERFTRWYNRKHQRVGTLWSGRFKSVLVENGEALRTMSAYIDLNSVRAGIVEDPKDYRWCGYAEAVAGSRHARRGLCMVMEKPQDSWGEKSEGSGAWYRCWLMLDGEQVELDEWTESNQVKIRKGIPLEKTEKSLAAKGQLTAGECLLSRLKYMSAGAAIGSKSFIETIFAKHRQEFGACRKSGSKPLGGNLAGLYSLLGKMEKVYLSKESDL